MKRGIGISISPLALAAAAAFSGSAAVAKPNALDIQGLDPDECTLVQVEDIVNGIESQRAEASDLCGGALVADYQVKNVSQQSVDSDSFIARWDIIPGASAYEVYRDVSVINGTPGWRYAVSTDNLQGFTGFAPNQCTLIQVAAIVNGVLQQRSEPTNLCTLDADPAPAPTRRVASVHPFSSSAFINTSVGSGIQFAPESDPRNADIRKNAAGLASLRWSVRVVEAKATDPIVQLKVVSGGSTWLVERPDGQPIRIPVNAEPGAGTDQHLAVIQPDGQWMAEGWVMKKVDDTHWTAGYAGMTDLLTDGRAFGARASGISQIHGQITKEEVASGKINHALSLGIDNDALKYTVPGGADGRTAGVWPARRQDGDAKTAYTGSIPMGQMFAIPASVDITRLGLTPEGLSVARALQDYGAYVLIRAGGTNITAEPSAEETYPAKVQNMRSDWTRILPYLRAVANSTETSVAGGGTPKIAPLPEVVAR